MPEFTQGIFNILKRLLNKGSFKSMLQYLGSKLVNNSLIANSDGKATIYGEFTTNPAENSTFILVSTDGTKITYTAKSSPSANTEFDRDGTVTDVANLTCFLVSENAHYITGQTINVDGGKVMI